jgi:hypothetical protein
LPALSVINDGAPVVVENEFATLHASGAPPGENLFQLRGEGDDARFALRRVG